MKRITVFIEKHNKILYLDPPIIINTGSTLVLKNASVFWKYDNVILAENDSISLTKSSKNKIISFGAGYWTFSMIKEKMAEYAVKLEATKFNNKCLAKSVDGDLNLLNFAPLLGFPKNFVLRKGVWEKSIDVVNVNQDFKFVNISCSVVSSFENHNTKGNKSSVLASLPVTTKQPLNGTSTFYKGVNSEVQIGDGCYNRIDFEVEANNGLAGACVDVLLELYIKT